MGMVKMVKSKLPVLIVLFVGLAVGLIATWFYLRDKFNGDRTPETYTYINRFETGGVPSFELQSMGGGVFDFSKVSEPIVIVNFWASWCDPCVQEFASMLRLVEELKGKVLIVAVSMDDDLNDLKTFLKLFKVPRAGFEVVWDPEKKVGRAYGVGKLPESFVVGVDRKLIRKVMGSEDWGSEQAQAYFSGLAAQAKAVEASGTGK